MLANSLAESGAFVRFLGFGDTRAVPGGCAGIEWLAVPGSKRGKAFAACSSLPVAAAIDATNAYRLLLDTQLRERWDAVVLDGYGTGWALGRCVSYRDGSRAHRPVLVHVSHNHEELLWCALAREARGSTVTRYTLRRNASKVSALERRIVRNADLVTTITDEDRQTLGTGLDQDRMLTLTPGYVGWVADGRLISAATPRRVIIMGSFQWVVKQENLARFVEIADPIFQQHGIALDVVGDVPRELLRRLQARCRSTCFHGFVADVAPLLARARIGVVPESIGGGFKLKFLDYIFGRVPVATVSQAAAGLPEELRCTMLSNSSLEGVVEDIVSHIDRPDTLNQMQERAFAVAKARFRWSARGEELRQALARAQQQLSPTQGKSMEDAERIRREREYHNLRFADDSARESRVGRFYSAIRYGFELYRRRVSEEARGRRVLEYGCGTGSLAFGLADQAGHVIGIDISDVAIQQAQRASGFRGLRNVEFVVDNAEAMRLPEKHVDVVAGSGIVHHLDIPKSMSEVRRVLSGGGIAIFAEPLAHNPVLNWYRNRTPELRSPDEHPLTVADLRGMALGFSSTKFTYFGLVAPLLGFISTEAKADSWTTRFTWWLDRMLCSVPGLNRYAWYCLIELRNA
jgi:ubiquinone/menaquinone biosynthesis C-methylase UbiE/glycosyltransferase involved in cell wall biosynthesis